MHMRASRCSQRQFSLLAQVPNPARHSRSAGIQPSNRAMVPAGHQVPLEVVEPAVPGSNGPQVRWQCVQGLQGAGQGWQGLLAPQQPPQPPWLGRRRRTFLAPPRQLLPPDCWLHLGSAAGASRVRV